MKKEILSGLLVNAAMRKQVVSLPQGATIDRGIASLIKYKINAFLTMDKNGRPASCPKPILWVPTTLVCLWKPPLTTS